MNALVGFRCGGALMGAVSLSGRTGPAVTEPTAKLLQR
jgi:hypothetical protein